MAARVLLTPVDRTVPQIVNPGANAADVTLAAGSLDGNYFVHTGRELLIARNVAVAAKTVTIAGKADELGRAGSITAYSIGASEVAIFGPFPADAYRQSDGRVNVDVETVDVTLAVIRF